MNRRRFIITGISISVVFLIILLYFFGRWILNETYSWLSKDAENFARAITNSLIESIKVPWETGDDMTMNSIIYRIKKENREIEEIALIQKDKTIIAHTNTENILTKFKLPEDAPFDLKSYEFKIKGNKVYVFKSALSTLGDTLGYVYMSMIPGSLLEGKDALRRILFLFVIALSALFLFLSAIVVFLSTPEERKVSYSPPHFSDYVSSLIPESGGYKPESWEIYEFYEKGKIPNLFYKIFRISPEKWGIMSFQVISGGYNWSILFPFINSYLDRNLFTEEDPYVILQGLTREFSKINIGEGVVEGSILFFDQGENKVKGASFGDHILFRIRNGELINVFEPGNFYDFRTKNFGLKYFEVDFEDKFLLVTGNFFRWEKFEEISKEIVNSKTREEIKKVREDFRFICEKAKLNEGILALYLRQKKEV